MVVLTRFQKKRESATYRPVCSAAGKKIINYTIFLVVNGSNPRFDGPLLDMLEIFTQMFGRGFLESNTVFEFTRWKFDPVSVEDRDDANDDRIKQGKQDPDTSPEEYWENELNKMLRRTVS